VIQSTHKSSGIFFFPPYTKVHLRYSYSPSVFPKCPPLQDAFINTVVNPQQMSTFSRTNMVCKRVYRMYNFHVLLTFPVCLAVFVMLWGLLLLFWNVGFGDTQTVACTVTSCVERKCELAVAVAAHLWMPRRTRTYTARVCSIVVCKYIVYLWNND